MMYLWLTVLFLFGDLVSSHEAENPVTITANEGSSNPCQISIIGNVNVQHEDEVSLQCSTTGACKDSPKWNTSALNRSSHELPASDSQHVKSIQLNFTAPWWYDGKMISCWLPGKKECDARHVTLTVEYSPKETHVKVSPGDMKEGDTVNLTCHSKGNPEPSISWYKEGNIEGPKDKSWVFNVIKAEDAGKYFCLAENKHGEQNSAIIKVDVKYSPKGPKITSGANLSWIVSGNDISLTCTIERSNPAPSSFIWHRNSAHLQTTKQTHRFTAIKAEDSGSYKCQALNSVGESTESTNVEIIVNYGPRYVNVKQENVHCCEVKVGHRLALVCETDSHPKPSSYTWYRATESLFWKLVEIENTVSPESTDKSWKLRAEDGENGQLSWKIQDGGRTLTRERIDVMDAAWYMCQAENSISAMNSSSSRVNVLYPPTSVNLTMTSTVRESDLLTINCSTDSFPPSKLILERAPSPTHSDLPDRMTETDPPSNFLTLSLRATVEHAGLYTCKASNSEGENRTLQELVVQHAPRSVQVTANPSNEVMENTDLNLTCTAQAIPTITAYTWYKTSGGRAETVGQGPVLSLSDLSKDHTGEYLCATRNEIGGGNSSSVSVRVKYGPKHTEVIHNLTRWPIKGQAVALSCQSQSYPPIDRYTWYLVTGTAREELVSSSQNLTIDPDKQGTYYCNAKNTVSSSSSPLVDIVFEDITIQLLKIAICCVGALIFIIIIITIIVVYRKKSRKYVEQGVRYQRSFFQTSRNGTRETLVMAGVGDPQRSRESLSTVGAPHQDSPANQHHPDNTSGPSGHTVYSTLAVSANSQQGPSPRHPKRDRDEHAEVQSINYATLNFPGKMKTSDPKTEEYSECVYSQVSKPKEEEERDYENVTGRRDAETSADRDEAYSVISFPPCPRLRRRHDDDDDTSSDEDDPKTQYSDIKI
ncbi:hypothetical protein AGOR_G00119510 [Albula goreensis]|uniref:Ig-like domain-containing protein n=1 Tax=Albula goreensis TaxID=1534307 RepID=A0A8T3DBY6_9TELE|nr:hypothetical protein AGOR_G00119510 [Albula goreensis]